MLKFGMDKYNKPFMTATKEDVDKVILPLLNYKFLAGIGCFYILVLLLKQQHEKELTEIKFKHEEKMKDIEVNKKGEVIYENI